MCISRIWQQRVACLRSIVSSRLKQRTSAVSALSSMHFPRVGLAARVPYLMQRHSKLSVQWNENDLMLIEKKKKMQADKFGAETSEMSVPSTYRCIPITSCIL